VFEDTLPYQYYNLNFAMSYFSAMAPRSFSGRDFIYLFHPGHQAACHRHIRPSSDAGLSSYFLRNRQVPQLCCAIAFSLSFDNYTGRVVTPQQNEADQTL
jgi:hypothetical protein